MVLRRIMLLIGVLVLIQGLSQVVAAQLWLRVMPSILTLPSLRIFGVVALLMGIALLAAAVKREVSLRIFVLILGVLMLVDGVAMLAWPAAMREAVNSLFLSLPHSSQLTMTMVRGVGKAIVGALLIYSASKIERRSVSR
jgi:uncharacterized protein YjeT (DUF2065 family)